MIPHGLFAHADLFLLFWDASRNCRGSDLFKRAQISDNHAMEEMILVLEKMGFPQNETERVRAFYRDDPEGLRDYVLYMRAILDDRHEYI